jgi:hypothetical protein
VTDRQAIAERHGIGHLSHKLVGETTEELEGNAAQTAGVIRMLTPRDLNEEQPEPPGPRIEGLPAGDKPVTDYTDDERAASHELHERRMREREQREQRERRQDAERFEVHANRTPDQEMGDAISASLQPRVKKSANRVLLKRLHPDEGGGGDR